MGQFASIMGGGLLGAAGNVQQGEASAAAANYNAAIARQNAQQATTNAVMAGQAGEIQAYIQQQRTMQEVSGTKASQAASGVNVNVGSAVNVRAGQAETGALDALTIRANAAKQAYGYQVQNTNDLAQSNLDRAEAQNDETAGWLNAGSTLLGSAGKAAPYAPTGLGLS